MLNAMSASRAGQAGGVGARLGQDTMSSLVRVSALAPYSTVGISPVLVTWAVTSLCELSVIDSVRI